MSRVKSFVYPVNAGVMTAAGEDNDCTVRALSNATGSTYEYAHAHLKRFGRENKVGMKIVPLYNAYKAAGLDLHGVYGTTRTALVLADNTEDSAAKPGITLAKLLPTLKGSYIVIVTGHAFAVKDGKITDYMVNRGSKSVVAVYKVKELN